MLANTIMPDALNGKKIGYEVQIINCPQLAQEIKVKENDIQGLKFRCISKFVLSAITTFELSQCQGC